MRILIVVDMLNDFIDPEGKLYIGETGRDIIDPIVKKVAEYRETQDKIIFLADSHREDDKEFDKFPPHCLEGTWGSDVIPELIPTKRDEVILKTRYSGFYRTNLEDVLYFENPDEVEVVGCCTSICVMDTVGGLANRDFKVKVSPSMVADFDQSAHQSALTRMQSLYGVEMVKGVK